MWLLKGGNNTKKHVPQIAELIPECIFELVEQSLHKLSRKLLLFEMNDAPMAHINEHMHQMGTCQTIQLDLISMAPLTLLSTASPLFWIFF